MSLVQLFICAYTWSLYDSHKFTGEAHRPFSLLSGSAACDRVMTVCLGPSCDTTVDRRDCPLMVTLSPLLVPSSCYLPLHRSCLFWSLPSLPPSSARASLLRFSPPLGNVAFQVQAAWLDITVSVIWLLFILSLSWTQVTRAISSWLPGFLIFPSAIPSCRYGHTSNLQGEAIRQLDEASQTAQDYSIMVMDPDPDATDPDEWREFFNRFGHVTYGSPLHTVTVSLCSSSHQ